ncbi:hypothetical protein RM863_35195 [Streptomyces sp. DSM 41014]|uniref:Uncharacterized protein n=1 Tax=Streptomyces hintoniae TaxID=3075521 RepID=A0ABU2UVQ3_9ACTN|nr:hypothetical protein [Streptomyces sp. DSM 41014]MDT0477381.1 hypothetical protein [Streptomyces sp. DSM 41014]
MTTTSRTFHLTTGHATREGTAQDNTGARPWGRPYGVEHAREGAFDH